MKAITNAHVVLKDKVLNNHTVYYDKKIQSIEPANHDEKGEQVIDAEGLYLIPGLIDQHIHGYMGFDTMDSNPDGLLEMAKNLLQNGVTGFLPSTVSMDNTNLEHALHSIRKAKESSYTGALILGAHLEGPYLNPVKKGAHEARYLKRPEKKFITQFLDIIKIVTLAPETSSDFISWARDKGVIISLGHTAATYDETCHAFNNGASQVTHLFNGMSGIHHQDPGVAGAALLSPGIKAELIADTIHVRKELFPLIYRLKGKNDIILISDCIRAGGMPQGKYKLGNLDVFTDEKSVRLSNGTLAGSKLKLNKAVHLFKKHANIPLHEAVAMASFNPAHHLGIDHECGSIEQGLRADLVLVDENMDVRLVITEGKVVYQECT